MDAGTVPPLPAPAARVSETRERARRDRPGAQGFPAMSILLCLGTVVEVSAAILLPAILVFVSANRPILAVGNRVDAVGADSQINQEILGGGGAPVTETEVVLFAPTFVAVAFDRELDIRVRFQEVGIGRQGLLRVRTDVGLVVIEVGILHILCEEILLVDLDLRAGGGGGGGGGAVTVTLAVAVCVPPGPVAVNV